MFKRRVIQSVARALIRDERGQGLLEYALILLLIAVALVAVLGVMGGQISGSILDTAGKIPGAS
ncbi:MAG TPA: Flp family type IVb pilin [Dehalococcoidia bacterium]|nr:Flp family type IVb pilin [Dehalococcoidia bacterium]